MKKYLKKVISLAIPIIVYIAFYSVINSKLIVDWLGCGCNPGFNANDFTRLFWFVASIVMALLSFVFSKKHLSKIWIRVIYALCVLAITLVLSVAFSQSMMWK
jgi:hypothetical protein